MTCYEGIQPCKGNLLMLNQSNIYFPVLLQYLNGTALQELVIYWGRQDGRLYYTKKYPSDFIMDRVGLKKFLQ